MIIYDPGLQDPPQPPPLVVMDGWSCISSWTTAYIRPWYILRFWAFGVGWGWGSGNNKRVIFSVMWVSPALLVTLRDLLLALHATLHGLQLAFHATLLIRFMSLVINTLLLLRCLIFLLRCVIFYLHFMLRCMIFNLHFMQRVETSCYQTCFAEAPVETQCFGGHADNGSRLVELKVMAPL